MEWSFLQIDQAWFLFSCRINRVWKQLQDVNPMDTTISFHYWQIH
jgi:hypothetical protein